MEDVREVMQDLVRENVVAAEPGPQPRWKNDRYALRADLSLFLSLARQYLEGPNKFRFLSSAFASRLLSTDIPGYLEARWRFRGPEQDRQGLYRLISVSPSGLNHILFSPTDRYASPDGEARSSFTDRERTRSTQLSRLLGDLLARLTNDMDHPQFQELLAARGIKAHLFRTTAKAASVQDLTFHLQADTLVSLGKGPPPGPPRPRASTRAQHRDGRGPTPHGGVRAGAGPVRRGHQGPAGPEPAAHGLAPPRHLPRPAEEGRRGHHLLQRGPPLQRQLQDRVVLQGLCLKELGDINGAQRCCKRALEIDPSYPEARDLMQLL